MGEDIDLDTRRTRKEEYAPKAEETCAVYYTSGSTGKPVSMLAHMSLDRPIRIHIERRYLNA